MTTKNSVPKAYAHWEKKHNRITTSIGKWIGGEDVYCHGYSMMNELLGKISYMQMIVLNATGKLIDQKLSQWLEGNFIGLSYPDARIWCNQIGALAGTSRASVVAGTLAGTLAADSRAYGSQTNKISMDFIQQALLKYKKGESIENIIAQVKHKDNKPVITGYARPVKRNDERLLPHEEMTKNLEFEIGEHLQLAYRIDAYLKDNFDLAMNIGGYGAAFLSDQGFTSEEIYRVKSLSVSSGVMACFADFEKQVESSFLPLRCDDIEYNGHPPRKLN